MPFFATCLYLFWYLLNSVGSLIILMLNNPPHPPPQTLLFTFLLLQIIFLCTVLYMHPNLFPFNFHFLLNTIRLIHDVGISLLFHSLFSIDVVQLHIHSGKLNFQVWLWSYFLYEWFSSAWMSDIYWLPLLVLLGGRPKDFEAF